MKQICKCYDLKMFIYYIQLSLKFFSFLRFFLRIKYNYSIFSSNCERVVVKLGGDLFAELTLSRAEVNFFIMHSSWTLDSQI